MKAAREMSILVSELAKRIKDARKVARLSQAELAAKIGVSDKSISAYEQGRSIPPFEKLKKITAVTNLPLSYFTDDNEDEASITSKLSIIERTLAEIKELLEKRKK